MVTGGTYRLSLLLSLLACANAQETGPICYNCPSTENPDQCREPTVCSANEVCSVQTIIQPHGIMTFWSGCEDIDVCSRLSDSSMISSNTFSIVGRRQASYENSRCVYCCSTDLCNHNCTSFVNLALHKPAFQSSKHGNDNAGLAVDGDTTKNFFKGSCMLTANEAYPWWAVDLGNEYHVTKVKLYERDDAGADGNNIVESW